MKKTGLLFLLLAVISASTLTQAAQIITPQSSTQYITSAQTVDYTVLYTVSQPQTAQETGLGIRVHYDSSQLTPTNTQMYQLGAQPVGEITADTEDFDSDPNTDKYFVLAWVDLNRQWPGVNTLPLTLLTTTFTPQADFSGTTTLRLTASDTAANAELHATTHTISSTKPSQTPTPTPNNTHDHGQTDNDVNANHQPIPTLHEWMLILLSLMLGVYALFRLKRDHGEKS